MSARSGSLSLGRYRMFLNRIHLNPRCREARRDLSDPYQLHSTLCRAFSIGEGKCPAGEFLWRLESEIGPAGKPRVLVQSRKIPNWASIGISDWLAQVDPSIDLQAKLNLNVLKAGARFRFRLRANPCVRRNGKRLGLLRQGEQEKWLIRKGQLHGFALPRFDSTGLPELYDNSVNVQISQEQMLYGHKRSGTTLQIFSALFDGALSVVDPEKFKNALRSGIGHGKVLGLGLLSIAPIG